MSIFQHFKAFLYHDRRILAASAVLGTVTALICGAFSAAAYSDRVQGEIAADVLRLHVIANSDSEEDQILKLQVRDAVIAYMSEALSQVEDSVQAEDAVREKLAEIEAQAEQVIAENGYNYDVTVELCDSSFPTKTYGSVTLPAGVYRAVKVEIDSAGGRNWWCVMFPPLCFVDITSTVTDEGAEEFAASLSEVLSEDAYELVVDSADAENLPVRVKFKTVELWQQFKAYLNS